jgi:hypothetical protein
MFRNNRLVRWLSTVLFWGLILYLILHHYAPHAADQAVKGIFGGGWQFAVDVWDATIGRALHGQHHGVSVH